MKRSLRVIQKSGSRPCAIWQPISELLLSSHELPPVSLQCPTPQSGVGHWLANMRVHLVGTSSADTPLRGVSALEKTFCRRITTSLPCIYTFFSMPTSRKSTTKTFFCITNFGLQIQGFYCIMNHVNRKTSPHCNSSGKKHKDNYNNASVGLFSV